MTAEKSVFQMEQLVKSKLDGFREAWVEEEKEREERRSQRLDTFAKVKLFLQRAVLRLCSGECHAAGEAGEGDGGVEGEHLGRGGGGQAGRDEVRQAQAGNLLLQEGFFDF